MAFAGRDRLGGMDGYAGLVDAAPLQGGRKPVVLTPDP